MWEKSAFGSQAGPHSGRDGAVVDELKRTAREAGFVDHFNKLTFGLSDPFFCFVLH